MQYRLRRDEYKKIDIVGTWYLSLYPTNNSCQENFRQGV